MHIILFKDKNWIYYTLNTNLAITYELKIMLFYGKEIDSKTGQITFASKIPTFIPANENHLKKFSGITSTDFQGHWILEITKVFKNKHRYWPIKSEASHRDNARS